MTALIRRLVALDLFTRNLLVKKYVGRPTVLNSQFWLICFDFKLKTIVGLLDNADASASAAKLSQAIF